MGVHNYLVEGVSGTGKTAVCQELRRRGFHAINGDRELAYQGNPETGEPIDSAVHEHHIWDVSRVRALVADHQDPVTFFCGGSRNFSKFIDLFDEVFLLDVDLDTLHRRLDRRPPDEWGSQPSQRDQIVRLHRTKEDVPGTGVVIDATPPLAEVVDEILRHVGISEPHARGDSVASPGIVPEKDASPATQLECDGEIFELRPDRFGGTHYAWLSGPNPGYGFSASPTVDDLEQHHANIRTFLSMIDPETGYIGDA